LLIERDRKLIITTHAGDRFDITEHVDQLVRLGKTDFRSDETTAYLMKLGRCITLAAGPNAPAAILIRLREKLDPGLWSHTGHLWAEAAETPHHR
jgi:hypothetical protein